MPTFPRPSHIVVLDSPWHSAMTTPLRDQWQGIRIIIISLSALSDRGSGTLIPGVMYLHLHDALLCYVLVISVHLLLLSASLKGFGVHTHDTA